MSDATLVRVSDHAVEDRSRGRGRTSESRMSPAVAAATFAPSIVSCSPGRRFDNVAVRYSSIAEFEAERFPERWPDEQVEVLGCRQ